MVKARVRVRGKAGTAMDSSEKLPLKRVSIVFDENESHGGKGFNVYLEGLSPQAVAIINSGKSEEMIDKLSPAEFWASRMFNICVSIMFNQGVVQSVQRSS